MSETDSIGFMAHPKAKNKKNKIKIHTIYSSSLKLFVWVWAYLSGFTSVDPSCPKQLPISHPIADDSVLPPTLSFKHGIMNNLALPSGTPKSAGPNPSGTERTNALPFNNGLPPRKTITVVGGVCG